MRPDPVSLPIPGERTRPDRAPKPREGMRKSEVSLLLGLVLVFSSICAAMAQGPAANPDIASLKGTWVRLEGGYTIVIKNIGPNGELEATYFNPNPLPFAKAQASREGATLRAFFELRAGGYGGLDLRACVRSGQQPTQGHLLPDRGEAEVRRLLRAEVSGTPL